jgi:hypothetical protein
MLESAALASCISCKLLVPSCCIRTCIPGLGKSILCHLQQAGTPLALVAALHVSLADLLVPNSSNHSLDFGIWSDGYD